MYTPSSGKTIGQSIVVALVVFGAAQFAVAQNPQPAPQNTVSVAPGAPSGPLPNPTYVAIHMEVMVNKPAAEVWARVGKYCAIAEWLQAPTCTMVSGKEDEVGSVRSIGGEVLVGRTDLSYTYGQTPRAGRPYQFYHGTLEAKPFTATTSKLIYTLMYDNSTLADDDARAKDKASRTTRFTQALNNMKILAEGGKLPPAPAPAAAAAPGSPMPPPSK